MLAQEGIQAFRRVARSDLDLLARGCGATLVSDVKRATEQDLGAFISSKNETWGSVAHWIVETEEGGATLIACGSTETVLGEVERSFADALGVACRMLEDKRLLAGGGATHARIANAVRKASESEPGRARLAMEAFARAMETVPATLADNSGKDPLDAVLEMRAVAREESPTPQGVRVDGEVGELSGVWHPRAIIEEGLESSVETAMSMLRIDQVISARGD